MTQPWTPERMAQRIVRYGELIPCTAAFIDAKTPGSHLKENFTIKNMTKKMQRTGR